MNINWKVRIKNKAFWTAIIPATLLLVQSIAEVFGYTANFGELGNNLLALVNQIFVILAIVGIVNDPTTEGLHDSDLAMTYKKPSDGTEDTYI